MRPLVAVRIIDDRPFVAGLAAEEHRDAVMRIPSGAPQRLRMRRGQRTEIAPLVFGKVVTPDGRIVQINLSPPLPSVAAAERRETKIALLQWIEDILLAAANAGRLDVGLLVSPLRRERIEGPHLGMLLAAAALIMSAITD